MKKILISSFSMGIGGVERSLINMLENFDYDNYDLDLMLYKHEGEFMEFIPSKVNLLDEVDGYNDFGVPIKNLIQKGKISLASARLRAKFISTIIKKLKHIEDISYYQDQLSKKLSQSYLSNLDKEYDAAISYVWPHEFIANKVKANKKIAWIHTDYSTIEIDRKYDLEIWNKFDYIISISKECTNSFLKVYPTLKDKIIYMENITSPEFIKKMAEDKIEEEIINDSTYKLVTVARLSPPKGIDNAVRAMKILKDRGIDNIKWYVIGYGPEEDKIKMLIKDLDLKEQFILLGKKTNPYPYIKHCNLYVQPSRYEGKAVTITEAQILQKPVLVTNYPTAKSQITNSVDGMITELSINGIADGIEKIINNKEVTERLIINTGKNNYSNSYELEKLYNLLQ